VGPTSIGDGQTIIQDFFVLSVHDEEGYTADHTHLM
jgi:hypothetical protein